MTFFTKTFSRVIAFATIIEQISASGKEGGREGGRDGGKMMMIYCYQVATGFSVIN